MLLGTFEPHSPEWHEARRWRLGGSEIAQACGWSPFGTRDDLIARKLSGETTGTTKAQERGTLLEPAVIAWAAHRLDLTVNPEASAATYVHDDHPWALANPDAVTAGPLIEAKTTADRSADKGWGRAGTDAVPLYYAAQCQWVMGVLGIDSCVLACLHGATNGRPDLGLALYKLTFNADHFAALLVRGERFIRDLTNARSAAA